MALCAVVECLTKLWLRGPFGVWRDPRQSLLDLHKEDVQKVAERLLKVETISQHDIEELVGPRPFATDVRSPCLRRRAGVSREGV